MKQASSSIAHARSMKKGRTCHYVTSCWKKRGRCSH